mmetsp:Transcript_37547/g.72747  ORF Transcript_37547/g.72747 Transcript_37547/m.72747 type:complete len:224 (-) Transcript_37547:686-1357(-)
MMEGKSSSRRFPDRMAKPMSLPTNAYILSWIGSRDDGLGTHLSLFSPMASRELGQGMKSGSTDDCSSSHILVIAARYGPPASMACSPRKNTLNPREPCVTRKQFWFRSWRKAWPKTVVIPLMSTPPSSRNRIARIRSRLTLGIDPAMTVAARARFQRCSLWLQKISSRALRNFDARLPQLLSCVKSTKTSRTGASIALMRCSTNSRTCREVLPSFLMISSFLQ